MMNSRIKIKELFTSQPLGETVTVKGWVRTKRESKNVSFIALNDGSTIRNLQIVADPQLFGEEVMKKITTGTSLSVAGKLNESLGKGQSIELTAEKIEVLGEASPEEYPLQPKRHSLEFLREIAHLRPRTNTFGAVYRIRHAMIFAVHKFFNERGFLNMHTPIITGSDAEGAGEMFLVTSQDIENFPNNSVKIFNRWGNLVWEIIGYDNLDKAFFGAGNGKGAFGSDGRLPVGTYFFVIDLNDSRPLLKGFIRVQ